MTSGADASDDRGELEFRGELFTGLQESRETNFGPEPGSNGSEFDEQIAGPCFAGSAVTYGESRESLLVVEQQRVTEVLTGDGSDLVADVEPVVHGVAQ